MKLESFESFIRGYAYLRYVYLLAALVLGFLSMPHDKAVLMLLLWIVGLAIAIVWDESYAAQLLCMVAEFIVVIAAMRMIVHVDWLTARQQQAWGAVGATFLVVLVVIALIDGARAMDARRA